VRIVTGKEMLAIDQYSIGQGMPKAALMESAGASVALTARRMLGGDVCGRRVHVLCGTGNNGGDGLVAARYLHNAGARVHVFLIGQAERLRDEPEQFYRVLLSMGCKITRVETVNERVLFVLDLADLIIDAMLGTGAKGSLREPLATLVQAVNEASKRVLAVDVPTGVNADTGEVTDSAIRAECTVTFGLPKLGLLLYPGAEYAGRLIVDDIGFPKTHLAWRSDDMPERMWMSAEYVSTLMRVRHPNSHKGDYGRVLVIAGSAGLLGAGELAARAAARCGAGLVTWGGPHSLWSTMAAKVTEVMTLGFPETERGYLGLQAASTIVTALPDKDVLALGPGIGRHESTVSLVKDVLAEASIPVVIDADALFALAASETQPVKPSQAAWVLTPHPGEAARLLGCTVAEIERNRPAAARRLAERFGCVVALKGVPTLVTDHVERVLYINTTGNPGMATGGTGDVLTGMIAGLIAQGMSPLKAAVAGVYLHGRAGDIASLTGQTGLIAGDLLDAIPRAIAERWESYDDET
jgi:hydroxyethylthiazole kinase-like uncharacterized protein yjeF